MVNFEVLPIYANEFSTILNNFFRTLKTKFMFLELDVASHHNAVAEYFHFLFVLIFFCIRYCIKIDNTVYHFTKFFICARFISIEATLPFRSVWKKYVLCSDLLIEYLVTNMHII